MLWERNGNSCFLNFFARYRGSGFGQSLEPPNSATKIIILMYARVKVEILTPGDPDQSFIDPATKSSIKFIKSLTYFCNLLLPPDKKFERRNTRSGSYNAAKKKIWKIFAGNVFLFSIQLSCQRIFSFVRWSEHTAYTLEDNQK